MGQKRGIVAGLAFAGLAVAQLPAGAQTPEPDLTLEGPAVGEPSPPVPAETPAPAAPAAGPAQDAPATCTKADFETVVDQAAAALRDLNMQNKPRFQEKLRQLKDKRSWSDDQFMTEAAPFVKDDEIDGYDARTNDLLGRITAMGDEGSAAKTPDCNLFQTLRGHMNVLVDTQNAKWSYMFGKIDAELGK